MLNGADACASPDHDKFIGKGANAERVNAMSALPHYYLTTLYYYCYCYFLNSLHFTNTVIYLFNLLRSIKVSHLLRRE